MIQKNRFFIGVIEDRHDPLKRGRVRVRVLGLHNEDRKTEVPISTMPWSTVMHSPITPTPAGNVHQLKEGTWVVVMYLDDNYQDCIVLGSLPSNYAERPDYEEGFSDPFGVMPRWVDGGSDTSLATKENEWLEHPTYHQRGINRVTGVEVAGGLSWDEPDLRGGQPSQYPYNAVREFESGILEEYDSTPNGSRVTQLHRSGSYTEFLHDGSHTLKIVGNGYTVTIKNHNIYVHGDLNMTVGGNMNHLVKGNYNLFVNGAYNLVIGGGSTETVGADKSSNVSGSKVENIKGDYNLTSNKTSIGGELSFKDIEVTGTAKITGETTIDSTLKVGNATILPE